MASNDPISQNINGVQSLVGSRLNKTSEGAIANIEGVDGEFTDEFTLKLDDVELLALKKKWEAKYAGYEAKIKVRQQANKTFYLGRQNQGTSEVDTTSISSNLLFEAEETFLPAALSKNPEPVVWTDNSPEGTEIANQVKTMLQYHADTLVLRRKLTLMTRHWSIYFLGVIKHGWDSNIDDIKSDVVDPQKLILDPDAAIDSFGDYDGAYIGERKTTTASDLIALFPKHQAYIFGMVDGKLGTDVTYTEWWSDEFCFYTFKDKVLDKNKNPHYNYATKQAVLDQTGQIVMDEEGKPELQEQKGNNHFSRPKKPYSFLSVFSLGEQPHDVTSLIEQNIPNQRRVTRRTDQIDYNLSRQNNSDVFSGKNFNQETAKQAAMAMVKGHPIIVPAGEASITDAIHRFPAQGLDGAFFNSLEVDKTDLRSIFGTNGITAQNPTENTTARGMILNNQYDSSRIGGGIGDALEQVADNIFNWWVQLYYVYYDEPHFAAIMGQMKATEYVELSSQDLNRRIVVSVAPDSLKPKDEVTEINQAIEFYQMGAIGPKTLLTIANFPNADEAAGDGVLYKLNPQLYLQMNFPELAQQLQQAQALQAPQPGQAAPGGAPGGASTPMDAPQNPSVPDANPSLSNVPIPK